MVIGQALDAGAAHPLLVRYPAAERFVLGEVIFQTVGQRTDSIYY